VDSALQGLSPGRGYIGRWFAPRVVRQLLAFRSTVTEYAHADVLRLVPGRAARSARLTTHFDLDFPREPQTGPYWCHKHKRECRPVDRAGHFIRRYGLDTLARIKAFTRVRGRGVETEVIHGDARELELDRQFDAVVTSPPLPRPDRLPRATALRLRAARSRRLSRARGWRGCCGGRARERSSPTRTGSSAFSSTSGRRFRPGAPVAIVVNDRRDLYPEILERAGLALEERLRRHVNRRTGRRAGEYFEDVLVARVWRQELGAGNGLRPRVARVSADVPGNVTARQYGAIEPYGYTSSCVIRTRPTDGA
jgi:hypothetical protein